ncbi:MAG: SpoIIE family protein phosphatase [Pseudodesulfovibrio sp.]|nr:SpoIIE family protein phosphatase [Pseudodesulfovibrio sp.]
MTRDSDKTNDELIMELAGLRARLYVCEEVIADKKQQAAASDAACGNEIEQLMEVKEKLGLANMIVENSPAVLFRRLAGENPELVYISENISQWGYSASELLSGKATFREIIHPDDMGRLREEVELYKRLDHDEYTQEYRIKTRDGKVRWISDETSVVRTEDGTPLFNQGVVIDITRRKKAEEALTRSEFKFRRTVEGTGEGYILLDVNLVIQEVNDAYCRMLGYDREELVGRGVFDFATVEHRRFLEANLERFQRQEFRRFEASVVHKDGHVVPVLVNDNILFDADGEFLGNVAFVADLTEQKKAVELAGEVQKSLQPGSAPSMPGLDVAGASVASEIAGGDYFDYLEDHDPEHPTLSVVVGDISGHGVDAALLMTTARGFLRMRAAQSGNPSQIVTEMNRHLANDLYGSGRFMTLFYLKLDPDNKRVTWVRAGHDPALIYCPKHDQFTELSGTDSSLPLGIIRESRYEELDNQLLPGQIIAIGTDGIWEARSIEGEMFGKVRFKEVLRKNAEKCAQNILDAVFEAVREYTHGARPEDDITLVIVKYGPVDE